MYSLSIFFGPSPVPAQFLFKDKEKADACFKLAMSVAFSKEPAPVAMTDDYGQISIINNVYAMILEDMALGEESRIQRGLSQARGQANANKRAMSDPVLQAANRAQSPAVITPFGNGRFNG